MNVPSEMPSAHVDRLQLLVDVEPRAAAGLDRRQRTEQRVDRRRAAGAATGARPRPRVPGAAAAHVGARPSPDRRAPLSPPRPPPFCAIRCSQRCALFGRHGRQPLFHRLRRSSGVMFGSRPPPRPPAMRSPPSASPCRALRSLGRRHLACAAAAGVPDCVRRACRRLCARRRPAAMRLPCGRRRSSHVRRRPSRRRRVAAALQLGRHLLIQHREHFFGRPEPQSPPPGRAARWSCARPRC